MIQSPVRGYNRFATHRHHRLSYEYVPSVPASSPPLPSHPLAPSAPIVLLHSLLAGRAEFADLRNKLARHSTLILPDARGHGASAAIADQRYTVADMVAELDAVLSETETSKTHLVGHDFGCVTAIAYACRFPDRVSSLTLIEPDLPGLLTKFVPPETAAIATAAIADDEKAAESAYKGLTDRALDQCLELRWGESWRGRQSKTRLATIRRNSASLAGTLAAVSDSNSNPPDLSALTTRTLIIHGTAARATVRLTSERLVAIVPTIRIQSIPTSERTDSLITEPHSDEVHAAIAAFLNFEDVQ